MSDGTGLTRGDKNRNERLARLRAVLPRDHAIVGIDLADGLQAVVVCDHDSRVLARRRVRCRAWELGPVLEWAAGRARAAGFAGVTVACEPTGHRWRVLDQLAIERGMPLVCVQPLLVGRARESEDYTRDKTDDKDAVLIARLAAELRCYQPERTDEVWARLRHLGARRARLVTEATACVQQPADLLECVWPAVLQAAAQPFKSATWRACLAVVLQRCNGDPARLRRLGRDRFVGAVRRELPRWGGTSRIYTPIAERVHAVLSDPTGVRTHRHGALERAHLVLEDYRAVRARLADTARRMIDVLDELELTELVTSLPGLSAVGAAAILAETGDPARFHTPRALVKHAGLAPRERASGSYTGQTRLSGRGRPGLRLAAWRAVWGALHTNAVYRDRLRHLTTRPDNPLTPGQARAALAAALLRQLHVIVTRRVAWDPALAAPPAAPVQAAA
ncbi:IS110 family transposase [Nonomuraea fuscirosea]|uniref:IS110 family transposase n=1 Tax=Nonomuraea fuscirosea TaxID=1291556 RepID=UPI002DDB7ED3|nr:IS110 family transposase [Nonomuraea fuscirosea]WSA50987.1 IS110 family transposase [Nonomuraea fuscirosea]